MGDCLINDNDDLQLSLKLDATGEEEVQEGVDPEPKEQDGRVHSARVPAARHVEAAQVRNQHRGLVLDALRLYRHHQRHRLWKRYGRLKIQMSQGQSVTVKRWPYIESL